MGSSYLLRGLRLLARPGVRGYVVVPLLINVLIFVGATLVAVQQFSHLLDWLMGYLPEWLSFIAGLVWLVFVALLIVVYGYTFSLVGNILAAPFYGLLAERVQTLLAARPAEPPMTVTRALGIAGRACKRELHKLRYFLPRLALVLILGLVLSFIPVANLLVPVLGFLWGAWTMALQYLDYPADNSATSFTELRERLGRNQWLAMSFGGTALVGISLPVLNLLLMPAAVAGATALWVERLDVDARRG